jgi:hypothetical protein
MGDQGGARWENAIRRRVLVSALAGILLGFGITVAYLVLR